jgi:hypothetical protein
MTILGLYLTYKIKIIKREFGLEEKSLNAKIFDHAVNDFFDIGDPILKKYKDFGLTENQYQLLKKFRDQFEIFSDENDFPEEFIDTPEWARIMDIANDVLKAFNSSKK